MAASDTQICPKLQQQQSQQHQQQQLKASGQSNVASIVAIASATTAAAMTTTTTTAKQAFAPTINVVWNQDLFRKTNENVAPSPPPQIIRAKSPALVTSVNNKYFPDNVMVYQLSAETVPQMTSKIKIQNIISMGENSSAYESSEDTGVGELSESELITAQDGIGRLMCCCSTQVFFYIQ